MAIQDRNRADIMPAIEEYSQGAKNAVEAGFDSIELHVANGYLLEQFILQNSNRRSNRYGGTIENRATSRTKSQTP